MRVLGIDPGSNVTGYGVVEKKRQKIVGGIYGEIRLKKHDALSERLQMIYDHLIAIIRESSPNAIVLEDIFYGKNVKSLIKLGHVRGVAILAASHSDIPIFEYSPLEIKKAVAGYGRAEKLQIQKMVKAILNLEELPPADASDALAAAICHAHYQKTVSI